MAFTGFSLASLELMTALTLLLKQLVSWQQFKQWLPLPPSFLLLLITCIVLAARVIRTCLLIVVVGLHWLTWKSSSSY
jgi:hypothetical protein